MSVSIGVEGPTYFVQLSHKGQTVQIPCKSEEEAVKVAQAAEEVEKKIDAKEKSQTPVNLTEGTNPQGTGEKLDLKGV